MAVFAPEPDLPLLEFRLQGIERKRRLELLLAQSLGPIFDECLPQMRNLPGI